MWAMLAALAMVTADIGSDWSSAMARGDDRVCFSRVGTGSLAAVGQAPTVVADEAEVCVDWCAGCGAAARGGGTGSGGTPSVISDSHRSAE